MGSEFQRQPIKQPILGIVQNVPPESIDPRAFTTAHNVVFRNGQVQKSAGWTRQAGNAVGRVNYINMIRANSNQTITVVGTNLNFYSYDVTNGLSNINSAPFQMNPTARWSADFLINKWYFTNQQDGLWVWSGASTMQPVFGDKYGVTGLGVVQNPEINAAEVVSQFQNHLILGGILSPDAAGALTWAGSSLAGSDGSFDFDTAPIAGGQPVATDCLISEISDNASGIQSMKRIGSQLVIYKEDSIHLLSYTGSSLVYSLLQQVSNLGLKADYSIADLGDKHIYVANDNVYQFNGSSNQAFGDRIWQFLVNDLYSGGVSNIWMFLDQRYRELYICYQSKNGILANGNYDKALIWNYQYDSFSTRDFPFSACGYAASAVNVMYQPIASLGDSISSMLGPIGGEDPSLQGYNLIAGDENGYMSLLTDNSVMTANGSTITSTLETGDMDFGGESRYKILSGMEIDCPVNTTTDAGSLPLQVYVAARKTLGDALVWQGPYTLQPGWRGVNFTAQAPWFRFRFVKVGGDFQLRGWTPRFQVRGWY